MAEARATVTTSRVWHDSKKVHVIGKLAVTPGPDTYTTGGIAFNPVTNIVDGAGLGMPLPGINSQPLWINIIGKDYLGQYDPSSKKLVFKAIAGGAEVAAGAIPAGLSNDNINTYMIFDTV